MKKLQELYDGLLQRRNQERTINPVIIRQIGKLGFQIYANDPLQFTILYGNILEWEKTNQEAALKFTAHETNRKKWFAVSIINSNSNLYGKKIIEFPVLPIGVELEYHRDDNGIETTNATVVSVKMDGTVEWLYPYMLIDYRQPITRSGGWLSIVDKHINI